MKIILLISTILCAHAVNAQIPTDGLSLFYNFNGNLNDESNNGFDATGSNGISYSYGYNQNAFDSLASFQYTDSSIQFDYTGNESYFESQNFSCVVNAKIDGLDTYNNLFEIGDPSNGITIYFRLHFDGTFLFLECGHGNSGAYSAYNYTYNPTGTTARFTLVSSFNPTSQARTYTMYINDTQVRQDAFTFGALNFDNIAKKINIGSRDTDGVSSLALFGKMDQFMFYNKALDSSELAEIWYYACPYANVIKSTSTSLVASPTENLSYQWYNCATETIIPDATDRNFTPSSAGEYSVITIYPNGTTQNCDADTAACVLFDPNSVGINETFGSEIGVYPNPASSTVTISETQVGGVIQVFDAMGKLVKSEAVLNVPISLDLSSYQDGVYFILVKDKNGNTSGKKVMLKK